MLLKYNISNTNIERKVIEVDSYEVKNFDTNNVYCNIVFTTKYPHKLKKGDKIVFKRNVITFKDTSDVYNCETEYPQDGNYLIELLNDSKYHSKGFYKYKTDKNDEGVLNRKLTVITEEEMNKELNHTNSLLKTCEVLSEDLTETTFSVSIPLQETIEISSVTQYDGIEWISLKNKLPIVANTEDKIKLYHITHSYEYVREETIDDTDIPIIEENPKEMTDFIGFSVNYFKNIYEWTTHRTLITCEYVTPNAIINHYSDNNDLKLTQYSVLEANSLLLFEGDNGVMCKDVKLYEDALSFNLNIPIINEHANELNDENIAQVYFDEIKNDLITDIIDYEKKCFIPFYKTKTENVFLPVDSLKFNIFFRDRTDNPEWNTDDTKGWFQCPIDDYGKFKCPTAITDGDKLEYLGFTDDDIYYRKQKVSKSFLRLSFYATNNPANNMLLFYSTIFLDSNDLYDKYIKNKFYKNYKSYKKELYDLTTSFQIFDKYHRTKSSEGFYLYLFPDNVNGEQTRTIYMKAEFNHAGYGKTIPLIYPNGYTFVKNDKVNEFANFPHKLIDEKGSLSEYYKYLYIPITLSLNNETGEYMYYFETVKKNEPNLVLNLFEPKINTLE